MKTWGEIFPQWDNSVCISRRLSPYLEAAPKDRAEKEFALAVENYPKMELHVHAEACVWPRFYDEMNRSHPLFTPQNMPMRRVPFENFSGFVRAWLDNLTFFTTSHFYEKLAFAVAQRQCEQNIVYSEVHFSPLDTSLFRERLQFAPGLLALSLEENIKHFLSGIKKAERNFSSTKLRAILDIVAISTESEHEIIYNVLEKILSSKDFYDDNGLPILVAIGIGGPEKPELGELHAAACKKFRQLGLKIDIHSGEQLKDKKEEIEKARTVIDPDRIGHGFQMVAEGLWFEKHTAMCPLSNILIGNFSETLESHPIGLLKKAAKEFSVNTDDPLLLGTTLTLEYVALRNAFGWDFSFVEESQRAARKAAFVDYKS